MSLSIIFEDNHILAINKPSGIPTQDTPTNEVSLEALAKLYIKQKYQKPGAVYLHAIHRLDKPASGIVIFAKTSKALERLNEEIRSKRTVKQYLALVEGQLLQPKATLENFMFHGEHRAIITSDKTQGQHAKLTYEHLSHTPTQSLLRIHLETGRYHQIRAQLAHIGHPILGDTKYGSHSPFPKNTIALHHQLFSITHPISKQLQTFETPFPPWAQA